MTNEEILAAFVWHLQFERVLSPATIASYRYTTREYLLYLQEKSVSSLNAQPNDVASFLGVKAEGGLRPSSVFGLGMALRCFHGFLKLKSHAPTNPAREVTLPKVRSRLPDPLTEEEVEKLLSFPAHRFIHIRDMACLETLYGSGLRASECLNLRDDDIQFKECLVRVNQGKGGKDRLVPMGRKAQEALHRYLLERDKRFPGNHDWVFLTSRGKRFSRSSLWQRLKIYARWAGIRKRVHPHVFRHSFASHVLHHGADLKSLQDFLGHAQLIQTSRYLHTTPTHLSEVYRKTHPRA